MRVLWALRRGEAAVDGDEEACAPAAVDLVARSALLYASAAYAPHPTPGGGGAAAASTAAAAAASRGELDALVAACAGHCARAVLVPPPSSPTPVPAPASPTAVGVLSPPMADRLIAVFGLVQHSAAAAAVVMRCEKQLAVASADTVADGVATPAVDEATAQDGAGAGSGAGAGGREAAEGAAGAGAGPGMELGATRTNVPPYPYISPQVPRCPSFVLRLCCFARVSSVLFIRPRVSPSTPFFPFRCLVPWLVAVHCPATCVVVRAWPS